MRIGKIQTRGQITLPREIRREAGLLPGDVVAFEVVAPGRVALRSLPRLRLADALARYRIEEPVDDASDRLKWQADAVAEVKGA